MKKHAVSKILLLRFIHLQ